MSISKGAITRAINDHRKTVYNHALARNTEEIEWAWREVLGSETKIRHLFAQQQAVIDDLIAINKRQRSRSDDTHQPGNADGQIEPR